MKGISADSLFDSYAAGNRGTRSSLHALSDITGKLRLAHPELIRKPITIVLPATTEDFSADSWLHSKQPVNMALDAQATDEMPAVVKLLHERTQHA